MQARTMHRRAKHQAMRAPQRAALASPGSYHSFKTQGATSGSSSPDASRRFRSSPSPRMAKQAGRQRNLSASVTAALAFRQVRADVIRRATARTFLNTHSIDRQAKQTTMRPAQRTARAGLAGYHSFTAKRGTERQEKHGRGYAASSAPAPPGTPLHKQKHRKQKNVMRRKRLASVVTLHLAQSWRAASLGRSADAEQPARPFHSFMPRKSGTMGDEELSDYLAALEGKITWAYFLRKWGRLSL
jgi:hypothetical protein